MSLLALILIGIPLAIVASMYTIEALNLWGIVISFGYFFILIWLGKLALGV